MNRYFFGGAIIVVFLGLMFYLFSETKMDYENDFTAVKKSLRAVKAAGVWVREKGYSLDKQTGTFEFFMSDAKGEEMKVLFRGGMPNNFENSSSVVAVGKYQDGSFRATQILTKCPSKYETKSAPSADSN